MKSQKGFSLIEALITIGALGILLLITMTWLQTAQKDFANLDDQFEATNDVLLSENRIWRDIKIASPSLSVLNIEDSRKKGSFYEYYPDVNADFLKSKGELTREVRLTLDGQNEFFMLIRDESVFYINPQTKESVSHIFYPPQFAYQVGESSTYDPVKGRSLTFMGLNYKDAITSVNPELWKKGRMLLLKSPALYRPSGASLAVAPRSPALFGHVTDLSFEPNFLNGKFLNQHPVNPKIGIQSVDQFLRTLPGVAAGAPILVIEPVKLVRYSLEERTVKGRRTASLVRSEFNGIDFSQGQVWAVGVKEVVFLREDVTSPTISVSIKPDKGG